MESALFALDLIAVVALCYFAMNQDDKEQAAAAQEKNDNA
jgi:hypothetical protein